MHFRGPSIGGWIGILYATTIIGSVMVGAVVHSASPEGLAMGYFLGFLVSVAIWYVVTHSGTGPRER